MNFIQLIGSLELGLIYSLVAIGVFLTFRIINFSDLTVDGSFPLGAAVMAASLSKDVNIILAMILSLLSGMIAGAITGYLNIRYKIMEILASILTMTALYSINLRIMGRPNISLMNLDLSDEFRLIIIIGTILAVSILIMLLLKTQVGLAMRSTGQNPQLACSCGVNVGKMTILTLAISNGLVALSGALFVLIQGFADISMGMGTIIIGLASVIIGEKLTSSKSTSVLIISVMLGAIIYRLLITTALNLEFLNLEPSDLNLISTILVAGVMIAPIYYNKWVRK
jgi:putative ABC transport system permease protein